jgi:hypothetical protein
VDAALWALVPAPAGLRLRAVLATDDPWATPVLRGVEVGCRYAP